MHDMTRRQGIITSIKHNDFVRILYRGSSAYDSELSQEIQSNNDYKCKSFQRNRHSDMVIVFLLLLLIFEHFFTNDFFISYNHLLENIKTHFLHTILQ